MGAYDVETSGPAFEALRAAHARLGAQLDAEQIHLVELAKSFTALALAMKEVADASGRPSLRFDVVAKALDLTVGKTVLREFLED